MGWSLKKVFSKPLSLGFSGNAKTIIKDFGQSAGSVASRAAGGVSKAIRQPQMYLNPLYWGTVGIPKELGSGTAKKISAKVFDADTSNFAKAWRVVDYVAAAVAGGYVLAGAGAPAAGATEIGSASLSGLELEAAAGSMTVPAESFAFAESLAPMAEIGSASLSGLELEAVAGSMTVPAESFALANPIGGSGLLASLKTGGETLLLGMGLSTLTTLGKVATEKLSSEIWGTNSPGSGGGTSGGSGDGIFSDAGAPASGSGWTLYAAGAVISLVLIFAIARRK